MFNLRRNKPILNLQMTIALFTTIVVALSLLVMNFLIGDKVADATRKSIEEKATYIARSVALSPIVSEGLSGDRDAAEIQNFANNIQKQTNVLFVVVFDMNGIRKSHPDPTEVGKKFAGGDEGPVLHGQEHVSVGKGTLGTSLRAFVPVYSTEGKQVGAVAVGMMLNQVEEAVAQSRSIIYVGVTVGLLVGALGALFLGRKIKEIMFGLEPFEIAKLVEERSAMLQSVREGILAVDHEARITLINNEGLRLFTQAGIISPIGKEVDECVPDTRLKKVLTTGDAESDYELQLKGIAILVNSVPIYVGGKIVGAIATFRDKTEVKKLADELTGVKLYAGALRAQAHEFMNKLHVILGMIHMQYYDQLAEYIGQLAQRQKQELGNTVQHIKDPVLAGFILGKLSFAREKGAELALTGDCFVPEPHDPEIVHDLITIIGNLVDNALDAVSQASEKWVNLKLCYDDGILDIEVKDSGQGIPKEIQEEIFRKGFSTKEGNRGYGLALIQQSVQRLNGEIVFTTDENKGTTFNVTLEYEPKE